MDARLPVPEVRRLPSDPAVPEYDNVLRATAAGELLNFPTEAQRYDCFYRRLLPARLLTAVHACEHLLEPFAMPFSLRPVHLPYVDAPAPVFADTYASPPKDLSWQSEEDPDQDPDSKTPAARAARRHGATKLNAFGYEIPPVPGDHPMPECPGLLVYKVGRKHRPKRGLPLPWSQVQKPTSQ